VDLATKLRHVTDEAIRLMAIVEIGKLLNSTLNLDKVLAIILDTAVKNLKADRGTVYLFDHETNQLWSKVLQGDNMIEVRLPLGQGIAGYVGQSGERIILEDAYNDPRFNPDYDKKSGYRTKTVLCTPMNNREGKMIGVFQIFNKKEGLFNDEDINFLDTLSVDACIAIENARLHAEALEKERIEKELEVAATIQKMIIPKEIPNVPGFEIAGLNDPSRQVGGDFYDVIELPEGRIALVIADVSGKSVPGALLVSTLQASLHAYLETQISLTTLVSKLNRVILKHSTYDKFITFFIGILDPATKTFESVNAGHNQPLLYRSGQLIPLIEGGVPLGMVEYDDYQSEKTVLLNSDILVMFTDGVTEAENEAQDFYEDRRLESCILKNADQSAATLIQLIYQEVKAFAGKAEQSDDITLLIVKTES
jgi:phosphoserine phosphatase RsbU/P